MKVAIQAFLNEGYAYSAIDHLGGRTSNFPGLLILEIPFYLMGNVGYLQVFTFLLLAFTLVKYLNIKEAIWYVALLLFSPAYWWEIFVISDLMSNLIIVLCSILLLKLKFKNDLFRSPILLGFITSFLTLTRGIVIIPLALFLFKDFWKACIRKKIKFCLTVLFTSIFLIGLVLFNCPDLETLMMNNPFVLQTSQLPTYIYILTILLPFIFSFRIKDFNTQFFNTTIILLFLPILIAFILKWNVFGFEKIIFQSRFDLSYLSIVLPFLIFEIVQKKA